MSYYEDMLPRNYCLMYAECGIELRTDTEDSQNEIW
jgi:hypothetical protein